MIKDSETTATANSFQNDEFIKKMIFTYTTLFETVKKETAIKTDLILITSILNYFKTEKNIKPSGILVQCLNTGIHKNHDYGSNNILRFGSKGIYVRIVDKLSRVSNLLLTQKQAEVFDEKIEDTMLDIINYCIYDIMLQNNIWE